MKLYCLVELLLVTGLCLGARDQDRVDFLPGLDLDEQPTFNHYAGYLNATGGKKFFYWFVESENNPAEDPVVLWLNGGPGCSSLTGFLVELGPWRVAPDGQSLVWFEQRWNKIANIIFMESPQCVGFSYDEEGSCASGDDQVALDNHEALKDFFTWYPEFSSNDFYITGESYAGIYVPTLAARIVDDESFNFKGFAVGNAVTDRDIMDNALAPYEWARGLFGTDLWYQLVESCCVDNNATDCKFAENNSPSCLAAMTQVNYVAWAMGLNPYNYLQECFGGAPDPNGLIYETDDKAIMVLPKSVPMTRQMEKEYLEQFRKKSYEKDVYASIPCTDTSDRDTYLNNPTVREALHVPDFVPAWEACSTNVSRDYEGQYNTVKAEFLKVLEMGYRVLVFNGDLDMACNHLGDMWFVEDLNQTLIEGYKPWLYQSSVIATNQIAGWVSQYENLVYNQILGAGHFVPTDKPIPAYVMWEKFINDEPY